MSRSKRIEDYPKPTGERCRELFRQDEAGRLHWRHNAKPATHYDINHGYGRVVIDQVSYASSKIVWVMHTDEWPAQKIKHLNGNRKDDRFANLAPYGSPGVRKMPNGLWAAYVVRGGRRRSLGRYHTFHQANLAYEHAMGLDLV